MRWAIPALALCLGCATTGEVYEPTYHTPLASTNWKPLVPRPVPGRPDSPDDQAEEGAQDLRARMVAAAKELLEGTGGPASYGAEDLEGILEKVEVKVDWNAGQGLERLVALARASGAHSTDTGPEPGDIVFFHNIWDANLNGAADDWLSGCGVVVETRRRRFEAVVRSGHAPRQVVAWPDGPATRVLDGEQVNSFLRVPSRSDPEGMVYLAGQLYAGFIDIEKLAAGASE